MSCFGALGLLSSQKGARVSMRVLMFFLDAAYQQVFELCLRHDEFGIRLDRV